MENNQTQFTPQLQTRRSRKGLKITLDVIGVLLLAAAAAYGVYAWQQQEVNNLKNKNNQLMSENQNKEKPEDNKNQEATIANFQIDSVPFTFEYPSSWTTEADEPLDSSFPTPDKYSVTLTASGTDIRFNRFGSNYVAEGSRIIINVNKSDWTDENSRFTGLYQYAKDRKEITVSGEKGVRYAFKYENDGGIYTDVLKDGKLYSIGFFSSADKESDHSNFSNYERLISTFKFK